MPEDFVTIREAQELTGRSESTIRRLVRSVTNGTDKRKREMIRPSPDEVTAMRAKNEPFVYTIAKELLDEVFLGKSGQQTRHPASSMTMFMTAEQLINTLKKELAGKDDQLNVKDRQIESLTRLVDKLGEQLSARLHESNVLMKGLQDRLVLPAAKQDIEPAADVAGKTRKAPRPKARSSKQTGVKRPTWWRRLAAMGQ